MDMGITTLYYTTAGVFKVDAGTATSALANYLEQKVVAGEGTAVIVQTIDGAAPLVEHTLDVNQMRDIWNGFESQNPSSYQREIFAAAVGVAVGTLALEYGPWASILAGEFASDLFKQAYDLARSVPANKAWSDLIKTDYSWNGLKNISDLTNSNYLRARNFVRRDPLAIDLDGDGIETVGVAAGVLFDHDADAIKTGTGWLKGDDAFVVLDRNGNGTIDSGRELFGVDTIVGTEPLTGRTLYAPDGFAALGSLDGNGDKLFNASDAQYANVRLWRDLNQDGLSQANELQGLAEAGIASIDLATQKANKTLPGGNTQTLTAAVAGLGENAAVSLNLADNPFYREFPDHLDTSAVASLPDMAGSGRVRDLKEAATLSSSLATQLTNLQGGYRSRQQFDTELDTLLDAWAATSTLKTSAQNSVLYKTAAAKVSRGGTPANGAWKVAA